jgi:hypothetical protein
MPRRAGANTPQRAMPDSTLRHVKLEQQSRVSSLDCKFRLEEEKDTPSFSLKNAFLGLLTVG